MGVKTSNRLQFSEALVWPFKTSLRDGSLTNLLLSGNSDEGLISSINRNAFPRDSASKPQNCGVLPTAPNRRPSGTPTCRSSRLVFSNRPHENVPWTYYCIVGKVAAVLKRAGQVSGLP